MGMTRRQIGLLPRGPWWRGLTLRSGEKEGSVSLRESGLGAMGAALGCGAGRPVPRNRAGIREMTSTQSSAQREKARFSKAEAPQREGGVTFSRKLTKEVRG